MGTLFEELARINLIDPETVRLEEARRIDPMTRLLRQTRVLTSYQKRTSALRALEQSTEISGFKNIARAHLTEYPGDIDEVLRLAHLNSEEYGDRKKLVLLCSHVRDGLKTLKTAEERETFLRQAFHKAEK